MVKPIFKLLIILFASCVSSLCFANYLIGTFYWSGWWEKPVPGHYVVNGVDWRPYYPGRQPLIGWYDDQQSEVDNEIILATLGHVGFFTFDWYTDRPSRYPGAEENLNNGVKFFQTSQYKHLMQFSVMYTNDDYFGIKTQSEWQESVAKWITYFQDPQYLKINGKPVFFIFRASSLTSEWGSVANVKAALSDLRQEVAKAGFPGLILGGGLVNPDSDGSNIKSLSELGFDFYFAYNYNNAALPAGPTQYSRYLTLLPQLWNLFKTYSSIPYTPVVVQGYDPRAWDNLKAPYFINRSPGIFNQQLQLAKNFVDQNPTMQIDGQKMIMIYAWNELGNGGELLPDVEDGFNYIYQIGAVFNGMSP
ncbi:Uncharacterised protein [Legionella steigerwaltii]|uniref:Uncharacterized protein n=1 Tax=Legionella steigerwaltii TaxID=460 RepID=A0A378LF16_9GAMM|nr:glycoside hydrolase family 99-like domain-containing protein [Legionella steigerwaltii]KTD77473.1 hypothetical protein Lstg_1830 [Legionella steigerwaltii]STY22671.1 Uncharacterised protein [Legionella steigerwaltii]